MRGLPVIGERLKKKKKKERRKEGLRTRQGFGELKSKQPFHCFIVLISSEHKRSR